MGQDVDPPLHHADGKAHEFEITAGPESNPAVNPSQPVCERVREFAGDYSGQRKFLAGFSHSFGARAFRLPRLRSEGGFQKASRKCL